jgi:4-hydroxybenzoate polyprenyltransferase
MPPTFYELLLGRRLAHGWNVGGGLTLGTALRLGRVSNLPTVWTNVAAGTVLSGAPIGMWPVLLLVLSLSLFYTAGMFLNDAFDREFDGRSRPQRPIPAGEVKAATVFVYGFALLIVGFAILVVVSYSTADGGGWKGPAAGLLLAGTIVLYDAWHKSNPLGPVLMGLCRLLVYLTAGLSVAGTLPENLLFAAVACFCYLIGLTYLAKQEGKRRVENLWPVLFLAVPFVYGAPFVVRGGAALVLYLLMLVAVGAALVLIFRPRGPDIPHAVMLLIAGISLLDGVFMAGQGQSLLAAAAVGAFLLTLALQRFVPGT